LNFFLLLADCKNIVLQCVPSVTSGCYYGIDINTSSIESCMRIKFTFEHDKHVRMIDLFVTIIFT